jgi:hypothetical protein
MFFDRSETQKGYKSLMIRIKPWYFELTIGTVLALVSQDVVAYAASHNSLI